MDWFCFGAAQRTFSVRGRINNIIYIYITQYNFLLKLILKVLACLRAAALGKFFQQIHILYQKSLI